MEFSEVKFSPQIVEPLSLVDQRLDNSDSTMNKIKKILIETLHISIQREIEFEKIIKKQDKQSKDIIKLNENIEEKISSQPIENDLHQEIECQSSEMRLMNNQLFHLTLNLSAQESEMGEMRMAARKKELLPKIKSSSAADEETVDEYLSRINNQYRKKNMNFYESDSNSDKSM